ncbi:fimbria/pilus periplasmic chaperone [Xenorhabdus szentirmaii]|uniref:fimbrial biogenesis chaperone n=1 Tax=Xenorhabdus szentirmaii TaxID=290112 RepID=UPI001987C583|nr:fimbria/pilus periplasmic chaperone [Xenorhabdus sp. ZM]MBD2803270.1 fimbria/pilus periplasmic chaperone [Xenorhabdus sp. ZM]
MSSKFYLLLKKVPGVLLLAIMVHPVFASVVLSSTRVIYPQKEKEVTVQVNNQGKSPILLQSWIDNGDAEALPEDINIPFILTPPVNRIDPNKGQSLRIRYIGNNHLPADRESLFWLNALEIPAKIKEEGNHNYLQFAIRTRIKILFRPSSLKGAPEAAAEALRWEIDSNGITAINDSPWYINLMNITVEQKGKEQLIEGDAVPPFGKRTFAIKGSPVGKIMDWQYINDYGAVHSTQ